ncbi:response regulator [Magnetococcales bacterium HHB-1]
MSEKNLSQPPHMNADILVVDDNAANLNLLVNILRREGFRVRPAVNGTLALRSLKERPADLVLLDIMMPKMNGYEVCTQIKENPLYTNLPVVFISAKDDTLDKVKAFRVGGVDYICKPFYPEEVLARVRTHLSLYEMRHRLSRQNELLEEKIAQRTQALEKAMSAAQAASQAKDEFLAVMSHEIRTPMNIVIGMADLLFETPLNREQQDHLNRLMRAGHTLFDLINNVLDLSRIEADQLEIHLKPFLLHPFFEDIMRMLEPQAKEKGLIFQLEMDKDLPQHWVSDTSRLKQVLINLLSNAIKFTEAGSVHVRVWSKERLHITVSDTGIGIDAKKCQEIFSPFFQVDTTMTRNYGGSGLGLAIAKKIMDRLEGEIAVESTVKEGSIFSLTLPQKEPLKSNETITVKTPEIASSKALQILLVEDSEDNQMLMRAFLKRTSHHLTVVSNGQEGVDLITEEKNNFDLILMDIQMPVMDGYTATKEIRAWENDGDHNPLPIFALTAHARPEDKERSLQAGCDGHLTKPIRKKDLLALLDAFAMGNKL